MTTKPQKFDAERMQRRVKTLEWAVSAVGLMALVTLLVLLHFMRDRVDTERIEVIPVQEIEQAPYETKAYTCTSGVTVTDYRGKCGAHRCEMFFKGKGQCAVLLP